MLVEIKLWTIGFQMVVSELKQVHDTIMNLLGCPEEINRKLIYFLCRLS